MSARRLVFRVFGATAIILSVSQLARAYSLSPSKWMSSPVDYYINPTNNDVSEGDAIAALQAAANAWSTQSNANIRLNYAGTTSIRANSVDNQNVVYFATGSGGGSTLAVTYTVYNSAGKTLDSDIEIYDASWHFFTGSSGCSGNDGFYIEDVITHEFGHLLGLNHSNAAGCTMLPSIPPCDTTRRSLEADDIAGIEAKYPPTGVSCDLDGNGVSVTDVQVAVNQAIGISSCTNADVNRDGSCNIVDVQRIVNVVLGGSC